MIESFVDLSYRGLPLGRRIKLAQVRPSTGYLEMPAPMPVGTAIAIATDEGVVLEAIVLHIHEQVGGSDQTPGMLVKPQLADESHASWWRSRVALADDDPTAATRTVLRPRSKTLTTPPAAAQAGSATSAAGASAPAAADVPLTPRPPILPTTSSDAAPRKTSRAQTIMGTGPQTITADEPPPAVRESRVDSSGLLRTMTADEPPPAVRESRVDSSGLLHTIVADEVTATTPLATITADEPPARERASRVDSSGLLHTMAIAADAEGRTTVMPAVDQQLLEDLTRNPEELARMTAGSSGEYAVEDDGKQTTMMDAVDPATLGLDMSPSGRFKTLEVDPEPSNSRAATEISARATSESDVDDDGASDDDGDKLKPAPEVPGVKKRRKKR